MVPSTQNPDLSAVPTRSNANGGKASASSTNESDNLRRALQEQKRAVTLLQADVEKERELRQALEAQLIEANAEIIASWNRRKEMSRVLAEHQKQVAQLPAKDQAIARLEQRITQREEVIANREQVIANRNEAIAKLEQVIADREQVIANRKQAVSKLEKVIAQRDEVIAQRDQVIANREQAIKKRDEGLAKREAVIVNRDEKIKELKAELRARYEELAAMQRQLVDSTLSGQAKRLARNARKAFGA